MDWPQFLYDQTDLAKVCSHWPARISEFHAQNTLYGHHLIYKEYAGLPVDEPLPWAIEHAIGFDKPTPYFAHAQSCLPIILSISKSQAEILRSRSTALVEAIGSAFFYMEKLFRTRHPGLLEGGGRRRGTIAFPCKSSKNEEWDHDSAALAAKLAALPEEFQPVFVSVFWRDYERGGHREFERAGLRLVSAGNQEDPDFLFRYLDMCRQFKYACANQIATSFCYSVLSGCRFFYCPGGGVAITRDGETRIHDSDPTLDLPGKIACAQASPFPPADDGESQRVLAERFAGRDSIRPPEFFQTLFEDGHKRMRAMMPASISLDPVERLDRLAPWQPRAMDSDGWAMERAGLTIPHRERYAGVRILFDVPSRPDTNWEAEWSITMDGHPPCFFRARAGSCEIELPAPSPGGSSRVWMLSTDPVPLQREARMRCFQLKTIEWINALSTDPFCWGYRKTAGGDKVIAKGPKSASFDRGPILMSDRAAWLLEGVDEHGKVHRHAAFTVPAMAGQAGVRLKIAFGDQTMPGCKTRLRVRFDDGGCEDVITEICQGSWYLEVPVRKDSLPRKVSISTLPDASRSPEPGDEAPPEFRIKQIVWRAALALKNGSAQEQMRFYQLEDLKCFAAQTPTAAPSRWRRLLTRWRRKSS